MGHNLVCLSIKGSTLRVANDSPVYSEVLDLLSADLTCERTILGSGNVLGRDVHITIQHSFGRCDVDVNWGDDNLNVVLVEVHVIKHLGALLTHEIDGAIGFPVAPDNVLS
jgi:hypothetical protein